MKRFLAVLLALACLEGRAAIFPNSFTTNSTGKTGNTLPSNTNPLYPLMILNPDGSGGDRTIYFSGTFIITGTNTAFAGPVSLSAQTNKLSIANNQLLLDGVPVTSTETAPVNNFYSTNNFFVSGKGNTLIVTQQLALQYLKTNLLATDASGVVTSAVYGTGISWDPATRTISSTASGGGDTTATNIVTLTQTGTNAAQLDFSLVAAGGVWKLQLTNNAYFGAPANVSNASFKKAWLVVQQPSTGTCFVTWTNGFFAGPEGQTLVNDTNNGAVVWYELVTDPISNGLVHVWMSTKSKLMP